MRHYTSIILALFFTCTLVLPTVISYTQEELCIRYSTLAEEEGEHNHICVEDDFSDIVMSKVQSLFTPILYSRMMVIKRKECINGSFISDVIIPPPERLI